MKHILYLPALMILLSFSCKKTAKDAHVPPAVELKTGGIYTTGDRSAKKLDTLTVGITATKTEDDLKSYNVTPYYDGASGGNSFFDYKMSDDEKSSYSKDLKIITRNQAGSEKWVFSIIDRDGNITQKTIVLTVN